MLGILVVHVDDFTWAGSKEFCSKIIENLRLVFKISKENTTTFKYIVINVRTTKNTVFIDQKGYTNSLLPITITTQRKQNKGKPLDEKEIQDFRTVIGQISWLAGISRPDLSFENCTLSTSQTKATVNDLIRGNKISSSAKK